MKKRSIAFLLSLVMLLSLLTPTALAEEPDQEGQATEESTEIPALSETAVAVPREAAFGDETTVTAPEGAESYQWQFRLMEDLWVNISGDESAAIVLTYAKVCNMLDESGAASLRCLVDGAASETLTVTVTDEPAQEPEPDETPVPDEEPVLDEEPVIQPVLPILDPQQSAEDTIVGGVIGVQADGNYKTYNIVINYLFENNAVASDPYTANLAEGSSFSDTVTFPTVQGYLPYVGEEQKNSIELDYTSVSENVTINVIYKPTNVNYTVIHYQQNVEDDNYTVALRETKSGLTKSTVPEVAKTYEGFYSLIYEHPAIAADGSTVVEIYYDRYYYLMNFDLVDGYGVEPIYARYGASISVGTPTKKGYDFKGWKEGEIPPTMPAENKTYTADWQPKGTAKVTFVIWGENANDKQYSYMGYREGYSKPGTLIDFSAAYICGYAEEHTHSSKCGMNCPHNGTHTRTLACYGITSDPVDPNNGFGDNDARKHFENQCTDTSSCRKTDLKRYLKDGSVCQYRNGMGSKYNSEYFYFLYFGGQYYEITQSQYNNWKTNTGKSVDHGHDTYYVYEGKTNICTHTTHTDSCYDCGKVEHTHSETCRNIGMDTDLWKYVRSDRIEVAADGSTIINVYYDRVPKTLTFKYDYGYRYGYRKTETITAKWGQNISEQYLAVRNTTNSNLWSADDSGDGPWTGYFGVMPEKSATYYTRSGMGSGGYMRYYGESLTSDDYSIELLLDPVSSSNTVTDEDRYEFQGFTYDHGSENGSYCTSAKFYYKRNTYGLVFNNGEEVLERYSVKYQAPLGQYDFVPTKAPSWYESGSVQFAGWYLNPQCTGDKYVLSEHTMPVGAKNGDDALILYAKWVPVTHKVEFYLDKPAYDAGTKLSTHPDVEVPHGSKVETVPATPVNGGYNFIGWFYEENGVEKAFDFAQMPVTKDMKVYGKWNSDTLKPYTVYYKYLDPDTGEKVEIAAPTTGSGLAGSTKTFEAKGGTDLYTNYQEGYFPQIKSHSMTLDINATEANDTNVYTFWYVRKDAVPYTVNYVTEEMPDDGKTYETIEIGGKTYYKLLSSYTNQENRKAVVTETFKVVSGYMPDAYQKRLVVSVDENGNPATEKNVINFIYSKDTEHAYYKITHYIQNTDGKTWRIHAESEAIGDIGKTYSADPMTIPGFTYDPNVKETVVSGELTANGLELKLFYTRNRYPYQVRYLKEGTGEELHAPKKSTGKYGQVISEEAIAIDGYQVVNETPQTLTIRIEEGEEAKLNIITFYYKLALADLTITKTGCANIDEHQSFIFTVTGEGLPPAGLKVVVTGNGSVTIKGLKVGTTYTITEDTGWSWRYTPEGGEQKKTLDVDKSKNTVIFSNERTESKWLNGCSWAENNWAFGKKKTDKNPNGETN